MATLVKCASCKREISDTARVCPYCGDSDIEKRKRDATKKEWIGYLILTLTVIGWFGKKNYEIIKFGFKKYKAISILILLAYIGTFTYFYFNRPEDVYKENSFVKLTVIFLILGQLILIGIYEAVKLMNPTAILDSTQDEIQVDSNNPIQSLSEKNKHIAIGAVITIALALGFWYFNKNQTEAKNENIATSVADENKTEPIPAKNENVDKQTTSQENESQKPQLNRDTINENSVPTQSNNQNTETSSNESNDYLNKFYTTNGSAEHKVYFYNSPDLSTRRTAYFDNHENIKVVKIKNGFAYVEFTNSRGQQSIGWVRTQDLIETP